MEIRPVGEQLFRTDGRTRQAESRFQQFYEKA